MQNNDSKNSNTQDIPTHEFLSFALENQTNHLAERINLFRPDRASCHQLSRIAVRVDPGNQHTPPFAHVISKTLPDITENSDTNPLIREAF